MSLKRSTINELKSLGLDTDWPSEDFARRVIQMELDKRQAERRKKEEEEAKCEAIANWPKELWIGAELEEVASERHVIITNLDFDKGEVTYRLIPHPWEKVEEMQPQTWDMEDELRRLREGFIRIAKSKED